MLRKLGLVALTFAVGLALAGCGASTIWAEGTLDSGSAMQLSSMATENFATTAQLFTDPGSIGTLSIAPSQMLSRTGFEPLETTPCDSGSVTTDTVNGTTSTAYNNCRFSSAEGSFLMNGTFYEAYGPAENFHVWTNPALEFEVFDADGSLLAGMYMDIDARLTASDGAYALDYYIDMELTDGEEIFSLFYDMIYAYTPDNSTDPMAAGTIDYDGTMRFRDSTNVTEYTLSVATPEPLHYTASCAEGIDDGNATYSDGTNLLKIDVTGCGSYVAYLNNEQLTPAATAFGALR
jgi:hypothetical protein